MIFIQEYLMIFKYDFNNKLIISNYLMILIQEYLMVFKYDLNNKLIQPRVLKKPRVSFVKHKGNMGLLLRNKGSI